MRTFGHFRIASHALLILTLLGVPLAAHAVDNTFRAPTKEELSMTELKGYPGAAAVILYREETDLSDLHVQQHYERIKILTEKGKDLANVELTYVTANGDDDFIGEPEDRNVTDIVGRTIHPDGTIIPFTGKPYHKTITKGTGFKYMAQVFTLPDVEVGSIIEYRYAIRLADHWFDAPDWYIQGPYYVKAAHYIWNAPTAELMSSTGASVNNISWFPILPPGATVEHHDLPGKGIGQDIPPRQFEVSVKDVPPSPEEEYMPPIASFTYRVLFNLTEYHSADEFWKDQGKHWSKSVDNYSEPGSVRSAADTIVAGAATPEEKLRKLYGAVQALENTAYTRAHEKSEDKAAGLGKIKNVKDILERKRGDSEDLAMLFLGMARAEGFKAYAMLVPDRTHDLFTPSWLSMHQFGGMVVIVNVDGKEEMFDPGSRYTPFGHLAWQHTFVRGLRQVDGSTAFGQTSGDGYKSNRTGRVANLTMAADGDVSGKVTLTFTGSPAVEWRQRALRGDEESIHHSLRKDMEEMLPRSMEVKVESIDGLADYEKPLVVNYTVKGPIATTTGKRMVVPADVFLANEVATFPHEKRELSVYFHYARLMQDAVRITFPPSMTVEAAPSSTKEMFKTRAQYDIAIATTDNSVTTRRNLTLGEFAINPQDYGEFRSFYSKFEAKDKEPLVLKLTSPPATTASTSPEGSGQ